MLETALRLAAAVGSFAGHWLRLQMVHDLKRVHLRTGNHCVPVPASSCLAGTMQFPDPPRCNR